MTFARYMTYVAALLSLVELVSVSLELRKTRETVAVLVVRAEERVRVAATQEARINALERRVEERAEALDRRVDRILAQRNP